MTKSDCSLAYTTTHKIITETDKFNEAIIKLLMKSSFGINYIPP